MIRLAIRNPYAVVVAALVTLVLGICGKNSEHHGKKSSVGRSVSVHGGGSFVRMTANRISQSKADPSGYLKAAL